MYVNAKYIKNQTINLLFWGALIGSFWFLLSMNECSMVDAELGVLKTCRCKGYEIIVKNDLENKGEKSSLCLGYIAQNYDLSGSELYPTEADCETITQQLCEFKACGLNVIDRTLPEGCKTAGEGWITKKY